MNWRKLVFVGCLALVGGFFGMSMGIAAGGTAVNAAPYGAVLFGVVGTLFIWNVRLSRLEEQRKDGKKPKQDAPEALVQEGVQLAEAGFSWFTRVLLTIWNAEMGLLGTLGVLPFFQRGPWKFVVLAVVLLAFVFPLGVVFTLSGLAVIWSGAEFCLDTFQVTVP